jgi:hypothetical protein
MMKEQIPDQGGKRENAPADQHALQLGMAEQDPLHVLPRLFVRSYNEKIIPQVEMEMLLRQGTERFLQ